MTHHHGNEIALADTDWSKIKAIACCKVDYVCIHTEVCASGNGEGVYLGNSCADTVSNSLPPIQKQKTELWDKNNLLSIGYG